MKMAQWAMSGEQLSIGSWVLVREDCPMYHMVNGSDEVEFTIGSGSAVFDFRFSAESLRRFVRGGLKALQEMDEMRLRENTRPL
jgi:hypothetical protein